MDGFIIPDRDFKKYHFQVCRLPNIYERYMQQFIDYFNNSEISFDTLSESVLTDYCYFRDETEQTKRARMNMMIQYATYLKRIEFNISIPRHRNHSGMPTH